MMLISDAARAELVTREAKSGALPVAGGISPRDFAIRLAASFERFPAEESLGHFMELTPRGQRKVSARLIRRLRGPDRGKSRQAITPGRLYHGRKDQDGFAPPTRYSPAGFQRAIRMPASQHADGRPPRRRLLITQRRWHTMPPAASTAAMFNIFPDVTANARATVTGASEGRTHRCRL